MTTMVRRFYIPAALLLIIAGFTAASCPKAESAEPTIRVSGRAQKVVQADKVYIVVQLERRGESEKKAVDKVKEVMDKVTAGLKREDSTFVSITTLEETTTRAPVFEEYQNRMMQRFAQAMRGEDISNAEAEAGSENVAYLARHKMLIKMASYDELKVKDIRASLNKHDFKESWRDDMMFDRMQQKESIGYYYVAFGYSKGREDKVGLLDKAFANAKETAELTAKSVGKSIGGLQNITGGCTGVDLSAGNSNDDIPWELKREFEGIDTKSMVISKRPKDIVISVSLSYQFELKD